MDARDTEVPTSASFDPNTIERPAPVLLKYYLLMSLLTGPAFPFVFLGFFCKYATLKYKFDDEGVSMSWGVLFRREIHLTYRRIQDIHLDRNIVQRWMGLATVGIQTASGSARPEMSIEGILNPEVLRDYLYAQMRGARGERPDGRGVESADNSPSGGPDEVLSLLREIRDSLRQLQLRKDGPA
jgi:putative membrane protein